MDVTDQLHASSDLDWDQIFLYTDLKGWVLSNRILADLARDPGPGVVLASSYGNSLLGGSGPLDYCNGRRLAATSHAPFGSTVESVSFSFIRNMPRKCNRDAT